MRIKTNEHRVTTRSSFLTLILEILRILSYLPVTQEPRATTPRCIAFVAVQSILPKKHLMDRTVVRASAITSRLGT